MALTAASLDLVAVDPADEAAAHRRYALAAAVTAADLPEDPPPSRLQIGAELRHPSPGTRTTVWLALRGDEPVGEAALHLPTLDNLDNAFVGLHVAPAHRRTGVGRALLAHLVEQARAEGRVRLMAEAATPLDSDSAPGPAFAAAVGATPALAETCRRLPLPPDEAMLARLGAAAEAAGRDRYELVQWSGSTPAGHRADLAVLTGRMSTDAPLDDLHLGPEAWDAARIRDRDATRTACGLAGVLTAARDRASGRLVAFTDIVVHLDVPEHGWQSDTIVAPEHRGHRLGMWIKIANLARARAEWPSMTAIDTWNADSNPWMVGINEAMGFRPLRRWTEWELDLGSAQQVTAG